MFDLDIIIIGGGIAGMSTALFLHRAGHNVQVYERAPKILPVGAAISVWSNGVKVMNKLGLGKFMRAKGGQMDKMIYYSSTGELLCNMDLNPVYREVGERAYPVARGELQQLLMDTFIAEGGVVTLGETCVGVQKVHPTDPDSKVFALFKSGIQSQACDLLLGADGINSVVRDYVLEKKTPVVYHYTNFNGLVPMSPSIGAPNEWIMFVGEGKRASVMPVGDGRFYFFMGTHINPDAPVPLRGTEAVRDELKRIFNGWPKQVQALIDSIDVKHSLNRIPICDHDPLETFYRGRVCLIGDSMHSTTPTLGQGGCQALEDAEVLSAFINTTNVSIQDALERYVQHRKERVHQMVLKARTRTAVIYPQNRQAMQNTLKWYRDLSLPSTPQNILRGIAANLKQGPWPPRITANL